MVTMKQLETITVGSKWIAKALSGAPLVTQRPSLGAIWTVRGVTADGVSIRAMRNEGGEALRVAGEPHTHLLSHADFERDYVPADSIPDEHARIHELCARRAKRLKVRTTQSLYRGAFIEVAPGAVRRVVREDASIWRHGEGHTTIVVVEPSILVLGCVVYAAEVIETFESDPTFCP